MEVLVVILAIAVVPFVVMWGLFTLLVCVPAVVLVYGLWSLGAPWWTWAAFALAAFIAFGVWEDRKRTFRRNSPAK